MLNAIYKIIKKQKYAVVYFVNASRFSLNIFSIKARTLLCAFIIASMGDFLKSVSIVSYKNLEFVFLMNQKNQYMVANDNKNIPIVSNVF